LDQLTDLIRYLATSLVDDPDAVEVEAIDGDNTVVVELSVARSDLGKVIGREGRTARAMPSCAIAAMRVSAMRSSGSETATTTSVVASLPEPLRSSGSPVALAMSAPGRSPPNSPPISKGQAQKQPPPGINAEPTGFATASAETIVPSPRSSDAVPSPPRQVPAGAPPPAST